MIQKAIDFAKKKHKDQKDDVGNDYFKAHCFVVYQILKTIDADENLLCAGLLHDTLEDTETTYNELEREFNSDIASLVKEVSHEGSKDNVGYYFPYLETERGIVLKFADRISNLSRMECWGRHRKEQYLRKSKFWKSTGGMKKEIINCPECGTKGFVRSSLGDICKKCLYEE